MQPLPMYVNCDILDARQSGLHATNSSSQPNLIHSHPHPHPNLPPLTLPSTLPPLNISRVPPLHPDPDSPDTPSHQVEIHRGIHPDIHRGIHPDIHRGIHPDIHPDI